MALTELFFDTFTDTTGTLLTAHTPDTGLSWTSLAGNVATNAQVGSDGTAVQPFHSLTGDNYYTANTAEAETLSQRVEAVSGTAITFLCLRLRSGASAADGILIEFNGGVNKARIYTVSNGVATLQASSFNVLPVPAGSTCVATISAANAVTVTVNGTASEWSAGVTEFTVNGHDAGKFGWMGRKSYTTGGVDNFKGYYDVAGGPAAYTITAETVADSHAANDVTLTFSGAGTAYTLTAESVSDSHSAGSVTLTYNASGTATITSEPLRDNTNTLLANQALDYVAIYDNTTGALVLRATGISTNASGIFTVSDAALTSGITYKLDWKVTIQSAARMPAKAAV